MKPVALDLCCGMGGWTDGLLSAGWDVIGFDITQWPGYNGKLMQGDVRHVHITHDSNGTWFVSIRPSSDTESWLEWPLPSKPLLVCASPPCQEFSYSRFPFKKAREKFTKENPPDSTIWRACERIAAECHAPLILENVRNAQYWMGKAVRNCGSFYLWGDIPVLLPMGKFQKGFGRVKDIVNPSDPWGGFGGSSYQSRGGKGPLNRKRISGFPGEMERVVPVYPQGGQPETESLQGQGCSTKKMTGSVKYRKIHGSEQAGHAGTDARKLWSAKAAMIPIELSTWIGECFYPQEMTK